MTQSIDFLYAWVVTEPDGGEGVASAQLGNTHWPLIGADMARVKSLRFYAEAIRLQTGYPTRLVRFNRSNVIEVLP